MDFDYNDVGRLRSTGRACEEPPVQEAALKWAAATPKRSLLARLRLMLLPVFGTNDGGHAADCGVSAAHPAAAAISAASSYALYGSGAGSSHFATRSLIAHAVKKLPFGV